MSTTVESLELEVKSSSGEAAKGIDALSSSLKKLKKAVNGGLGLEAIDTSKLSGLSNSLQKLSGLGNLKISASIANQIRNIGSAVQSLQGTDFSKLSTLGSALVPLASIGKSNLSSFISQLKRLPEAVVALNSVDMNLTGSNIEKLASALVPLSEMGKNNLTSYITQLKKLPEVVTVLNGMDIPGLKNKIEQLASAFRPLGTEMQNISNGFSALPARLQQVIKQTDNLSASNNKAGKSYTGLAAKLGVNYVMLRRIARILGSAINQSNKYVEDLNLFTASMRQYAEEAQAFAEKVSDLMGIDPAEWMRNQGIFNTVLTGFGVINDRAYIMSQNLTQLGYDISSFFNVSTEDAFSKLQSGIAGELEPLRRLGYDLSVARLQQEALNLGIEKSVSAMTQAEKAELRYYAIMTQVTTAQGDMSRTLEAPANQLRILKAQVTQCARALGNVFIPALTAVLPYAIAFVQVLREIANVFANLLGFTLPEIDYSGLDSSAGSADDLSNGLADAEDEAKKLKKALMGFDELNVLPSVDSGAGTGTDTSVGGGLGIDLPTYDFIGNAVSTRVKEIVDGMKEWLGITGEITSWSDFFDTRLGQILVAVGLIGAGLLAWKLSGTFLNSLSVLSIALGAILTIDSIIDVTAEGLNPENELEGMIGGALIGAGIGFKLGGIKGAAIGIAIGIGLSLVINGIADVITNGVTTENVTALIEGALVSAGGIFLAIKMFNSKAKSPVAEIQTASQSLETISQGTSTITAKLTSLVKNLALGLVIVLEVAAAALLITGAIILLGMELEQVGIAWEPVINNGGNVAIAMGIGVGTLVAIGVVTALLGTAGTSLMANIALGAVMLLELGVAAAVFIAEIWAIGWGLDQIGQAWEPVMNNGENIAATIGIGTGILVAIGVVAAALGIATVASAGLLPLAIGLGTAILVELGIAAAAFIVEILAIGVGLDEIGKAWEPVLANGDTIEKGIATGTALLIAIGVVTAALGVATVASVGLLPVAIGLGTAILVELSAATIAFTDSLSAVADEMSNRLSPSLIQFNQKLPGLSTNMESFTRFMREFATHVVEYSKDNAVSAIAATIDTIIGWFTQDPLEKLANDVNRIYTQADALNGKLELAVPELETAVTLLEKYTGFISELEILTSASDNSSLSNGVYVDMHAVGENLVTGFVSGIQEKSGDYISAGSGIINGFVSGVNTSQISATTQMVTLSNTLANSFESSILPMFSQAGKDTVSNFKSGVEVMFVTAQAVMYLLAVKVKKMFSSTIGTGVDLTSFFNNTFSTATAYNYGTSFGNAFVRAFQTAINGIRFPSASTVNVSAQASNAKVKAYASGGYPNAGSLFIANEAGPEMVGTIGGRTAVANNTQIEEALYNAVLRALADGSNNNSSGEQVIRLEVDGDVLAETVNRQNNIRSRRFNGR